MKRSSDHRERRRDPRFLIDLPLEYQEADVPLARGGVVVNASESGFLIESVKNIPVGAKLNIAILFPKRFELSDSKLVAEIVRKEPLLKEDWEGYQYGLSIIRILDEERWKLKLILGGRFNIEEVERFSEGERKTKASEADTGKIPRYDILVVDDEEAVRKLLVALLAQRGHRCLEAVDGADALNKVSAGQFDAIVTDVMMPRMDGITLTQELLRRTPTLPIMVMTGHDHAAFSISAIAAGAREFIEKPFSLTEFSTRFDKMMSD